MHICIVKSADKAYLPLYFRRSCSYNNYGIIASYVIIYVLLTVILTTFFVRLSITVLSLVAVYINVLVVDASAIIVKLELVEATISIFSNSKSTVAVTGRLSILTKISRGFRPDAAGIIEKE